MIRYTRIPIAAFLRFRDKNGWIMSSHVAMSMMMALFPFMLFMVALAGQFAQGIDVNRLIELTMGGWPTAVSDPLSRELRAVTSQDTSGLISVGGVLALYFASNGVDAIRQAMTTAYREVDTRPWWKQRLLCLAFVLAGAALVVGIAILAVALPVYLSFVRGALPGIYSLLFESRAARLIIGGGFAVLIVTACHYWLPGKVGKRVKIWPGVALTVVIWAIVARAFSIYVSNFASYSATYAGLAGAMSALIFLYLMAAILIFGAAFNNELSEELYGSHDDRPPEAPGEGDMLDEPDASDAPAEAPAQDDDTPGAPQDDTKDGPDRIA
ncbi:YhjD/YihY/BrkB family envelope integrity protein [Marinibacterium sp. SX1]|uniref:YihY/virulence factor BrkB family protein n=1 Tax=Marinibacterium sp. SX1 TaxID=3388424 RepID=UPI003D16DC4D